MFCRILCCFVAKSLFYAIYAVLSRNLFCRYLRALAWRKIGPTILSVEKKGQISGMPTGALKWPKTAPKRPRMSQNPQNGSKWHCMTPDGPNDPKTLPMGI